MAVLKIEDVRKVGMYAVQCQTADGRAWQMRRKFRKDDPAFSVVKAIDAKGEIDTAHWYEIRRYGCFAKPARLDEDARTHAAAERWTEMRLAGAECFA